MKDRHGASNGADGDANFFDESEAFDGERKQRPRESEPTPNNLTLYKFRGPLPDASEERDLLRAAQAGDARAKDELVKCFHRLVLKIASEFYGPSRDDLIAAGLLGLSKAITEFDLRRNTRLSTFAMHTIRNAIRVAAKEYRKRGQAGETRADRWVYSHRDATAREVADKTGCSLADAGAALQRADAHWNGHESYDTTESGFDDDAEDGAKVRSAVVVDVPAVEVHAEARVSDKDWAAIAAYRERDHLKPITRGQYAADQAAAHRVSAGGSSLSRLRGRVWSIVDFYERATELRAIRRLKKIGRRARALELVEQDQQRIEARANPDNYLYPWVRLAKEAKANPSLTQIKVAKPRRPRRRSRIRVWRSADLMAAA